MTVKHQNDSKTGGTPITIVAEKYYAGDDIHQEYKGDNIQTGGHKGDSISVNDGGKIRPVDFELGEIKASGGGRECPNCGLDVDDDAEYCSGCQAKLPAGGKRKQEK
ncbi:MAG: hypothetical protein AB9891_12905 [Anaerolineaceae bacterium]